MASTFKALVALADLDVPSAPTATPTLTAESEPDQGGDVSLSERASVIGAAPGLALHHDIHIHLPPTTDVAVYTAIFRALRSELAD